MRAAVRSASRQFLLLLGGTFSMLLAGCGDSRAARATVPSGNPAWGHLDISMLPEAPVTTPQPWVPFAVEKDMRASNCPESSGSYTLHQPCAGLLPRHLAEVLLSIPEDDIHLPEDVRAKYVREPQKYLAIPGHGSRPDFMAVVQSASSWYLIRSFEGVDTKDTVYYLYAPFDCLDEEALVGLAFLGDYDNLEAGDCQWAMHAPRLYRMQEGGVAVDVTRTLLPPPVIAPADSHRYYQTPGLDDGALARAPTFRWFLFPAGEDRFPATEPKLYDGARSSRTHRGFAVWNGKVFDMRERVSDALWPPPSCSQSRFDPGCAGVAKARAGTDPFIEYDTDWSLTSPAMASDTRVKGSLDTSMLPEAQASTPDAPLPLTGWSQSTSASASTGQVIGSLDLSMLPEIRGPTPNPWIPYAVEKSLGAKRCPDDPNSHGDLLGFYSLHRPCIGLIPRDLAEILVGIPASEIHLPAHVRAKYARSVQHYLALPGFGRKPDFMAAIQGKGSSFIIRSFEGRDAKDTVYFVDAPFQCRGDGANAQPEFDGGYDELEAGDCPRASRDFRLYRKLETGALEDVTEALLHTPEIPANERMEYAKSSPFLDGSRLSYTPVFRWYAASIDEGEFSASHPRRLDRWGGLTAHFGFAVWDGRRFDLRDRVSRALWPPDKCSRWRPDVRCQGADGANRGDRFLDGTAEPGSRRRP